MSDQLDTAVYPCPYPECDWTRRYREGHNFSEIAARADAKRHAEDHQKEQESADHTCGYCGLEFDGADGEPCPRCRSTKRVER